MTDRYHGNEEDLHMESELKELRAENEGLKEENAALRRENEALRKNLGAEASNADDRLISADCVPLNRRGVAPMVITTAVPYNSFDRDDAFPRGEEASAPPAYNFASSGNVGAVGASVSQSNDYAIAQALVGDENVRSPRAANRRPPERWPNQWQQNEDARIAREQQAMYEAMEQERLEREELQRLQVMDADRRMVLEALGGAGKQCPACGFIIERVSGDHQMMCGCEGRPAGGTMEKALRNGGCGHEFNFDTLEPLPGTNTGSPGNPINDRQWKFRVQGGPR